MKWILLLAATGLLSCVPDGSEEEPNNDDPRPSRTLSVDEAFVQIEIENRTEDDDALAAWINTDLAERIKADFLPEGSAYRFFENIPDQIVNGTTDEVREVRLETEKDENGDYFIITFGDGTQQKYTVDLTGPYLIKDYTREYTDQPRISKVRGVQRLNALL